MRDTAHNLKYGPLIEYDLSFSMGRTLNAKHSASFIEVHKGTHTSYLPVLRKYRS